MLRLNVWTSWLTFCALLYALLQASSPADSANGETRTLTFPKEFSTGQLSIYYQNGAKFSPMSVNAIGTVSINVPTGKYVCLEVSPHCIEHPEKLATLPTTGIDRINMTYMSMEDNQSQCDKALAAMPVFKHPLQLHCTRTDVTDNGLLAFKSLAMLEHLDCFMSGVEGRFLKDTKRLQNLTLISLSNNALKSENIKYLSQLPKLEYIDLSLTDLTDDGMKGFGQLKHLKGLLLASNPKMTEAGLQSIQPTAPLEVLDLSFDKNVTDKALPTIHKFSGLVFLKVDNTKISAPGLVQLKDMKLKTLIVSPNYWKADMDNMRKAFKPGVVKPGTKQVTKDIEVEFAPLK